MSKILLENVLSAVLDFTNQSLIAFKDRQIARHTTLKLENAGLAILDTP